MAPSNQSTTCQGWDIIRPISDLNRNGRHRQRPEAWSVPSWHGVSLWRSQGFGGLKAAIWIHVLVDSESDVRHRPPPAEGLVCPFVAWCAVAKPTFWRPEGCNLELVKHRPPPPPQGLVRPSVTWCFAVAKPMLWRPEGCNLELVKHRPPPPEGLVRPSVTWCFAVASQRFGSLKAAIWR